MFRRFGTLALAALLLTCFVSFTTAAPETVTITLQPGTIFINGKALTPSWKRKVCEQQLGKADRVDGGGNSVYTYDSLGLMVYESEKKPGVVIEMQSHFRVREPDELTPKRNFRGKFFVGETAITSATLPQDLEKLEGWANDACYIPHCYRYFAKGVYIFFQFNDEESELTDISFGPDKR